MSQDEFGLALRNPQMLALMIEQKAQLDRRTRRRLERFVNQLTEEVERGKRVQDALSIIEPYTLYKVDQTLNMDAFLEGPRHPDLPQEDRDVFRTMVRTWYLEASATAAKKTMHEVVDMADRERGWS